MPFQSPKQRRYMHANLPEIANRWEKKYGLGGIAELNSQLNSLPEYYLPKNQGGLIPSHEAGIYGLAEGGNIRLQPHTASDLLVQETSSGERPRYQPPGRDYGGSSSSSSSSGGGGDAGHLSHNVPQSLGGTKPDPAPDPDRGWQTYAIEDPKKTTTDNGKDDYYEDRIIRIAEQDKRTKELRDKASKEGWHQFLTPKAPPQAKKTITPGSVGVNLLTTFLTGGISNPWTKAAANRVVKWGANKIGVDNMINTFVDEKFGSIDEMKSKIEARVAKEDLIQSLPRGHPERIQLEESVKTKTTPKDGPDGEGVTETSITIDNIEEVNDAKTQLQQKYQEMDEASLLAWQRQQEMQAKKEAYLRNFRQMYMSAQGGRVPGGYNTGGLSNLFRLKNV